jgi:hypothetical protein
VSQVEAAITPPGWRQVARMSVARFVKPLSDRLRSSGLSKRYEEASVHSTAAAAAAAVDSSTSASVRAAECVVVAPESHARCRGLPPGLPPPVLEHKVSGSGSRLTTVYLHQLCCAVLIRAVAERKSLLS